MIFCCSCFVIIFFSFSVWTSGRCTLIAIRNLFHLIQARQTASSCFSSSTKRAFVLNSIGKKIADFFRPPQISHLETAEWDRGGQKSTVFFFTYLNMIAIIVMMSFTWKRRVTSPVRQLGAVTVPVVCQLRATRSDRAHIHWQFDDSPVQARMISLQ